MTEITPQTESSAFSGKACCINSHFKDIKTSPLCITPQVSRFKELDKALSCPATLEKPKNIDVLQPFETIIPAI